MGVVAKSSHPTAMRLARSSAIAWTVMATIGPRQPRSRQLSRGAVPIQFGHLHVHQEDVEGVGRMSHAGMEHRPTDMGAGSTATGLRSGVRTRRRL